MPNAVNLNKKPHGWVEEVVSITTATNDQLKNTDSGKVFAFNRAAGTSIMLPKAAAGLVFKFVVQTAFTGVAQILTDNSADLYTGGVRMVDPANATDINYFQPDVSNDRIFDMGSDGQGRLAGGVVTFTGLSSTRWHGEGTLVGDGTLATPFE